MVGQSQREGVKRRFLFPAKGGLLVVSLVGLGPWREGRKLERAQCPSEPGQCSGLTGRAPTSRFLLRDAVRQEERGRWGLGGTVHGRGRSGLVTWAACRVGWG